MRVNTLVGPVVTDQFWSKYLLPRPLSLLRVEIDSSQETDEPMHAPDPQWQPLSMPPPTPSPSTSAKPASVRQQLRLLTALPGFWCCSCQPVCLPACSRGCLPACLPACVTGCPPAVARGSNGAHSTAQSGTRTADEEAAEFIAELEAKGTEMLRSKLLSPDDVARAKLANGFLKLHQASLSVVVAARLKTAVHILLFNVNGIKAARKWVLQENTRCAIMYLLSFIVPGNKEDYYIGESKRSGCTHAQLCKARWSQHYGDLACNEHVNGKLQDAYGSASYPYLARTRAHPVIAAALTRGPGSRWYGMEVCASPGARCSLSCAAPAFGERYPTARAGKAIPSQVATRSRRTGAAR